MEKGVQGDSQTLSEPFPFLLWDLYFGGELQDPAGLRPWQQYQPVDPSLQVCAGVRAGRGKVKSVLRVLAVTALFSRMNQGPVQSIEKVGNQTIGCFIYPGNASSQGSWRQLLLLLPLLLKLSGLVWTSDAPSEEVMVWDPKCS